MPSGYDSLPLYLQQVHWKIDKVENDLAKECIDRKENDKEIYNKFDELNNRIIYQLCAAILTLIAVLAVYIKN